ncbi:hypothetical protein TrVFT333_006061 [Trichoderma virens FT-333]|nr:hypothetical protein TrVFT333_006061 [Trichoderma virens FT-333]
MQPVNFNHSSCPKCSATIASDSKTCQSCGAVSFDLPLLFSYHLPQLSSFNFNPSGQRPYISQQYDETMLR